MFRNRRVGIIAIFGLTVCATLAAIYRLTPCNPLPVESEIESIVVHDHGAVGVNLYEISPKQFGEFTELFDRSHRVFVVETWKKLFSVRIRTVSGEDVDLTMYSASSDENHYFTLGGIYYRDAGSRDRFLRFMSAVKRQYLFH